VNAQSISKEVPDLKSKIQELRSFIEKLKREVDTERKKEQKYFKENERLVKENARMTSLIEGDNHPSILRQKISDLTGKNSSLNQQIHQRVKENKANEHRHLQD
jgi:hypothetical protein